jgi:hypothetical protein
MIVLFATSAGYSYIPRTAALFLVVTTTTTTTTMWRTRPVQTASAASEQQHGEDDDVRASAGRSMLGTPGHACSDSHSRSTTSPAAALRTAPGASSGPPHSQETRHAEKEGIGPRSLFSTITVAGAQAFERNPADHEERASTCAVPSRGLPDHRVRRPSLTHICLNGR